MVSIVDNLLEEFDVLQIQSVMMKSVTVNNNVFPWYYDDSVDYSEKRNELDTFQFTHLFWDPKRGCVTNFMNIVDFHLKKIKPIIAWRIKANLLSRTSEIIENSFHVDNAALKDSPEKLKQWTTSIYYVNTNNGYTKFETGEIVESVENRMVTFPSNIQHTGTSCTDEKTRVVINFNYFSNK